jgi:hypothetical protein
MKLKLALAGAALVGFLGAGLSMAVDSTDMDGGPLVEEDASSEEASPYAPADGESGDTAAGSAWFSTGGGQRR